jgi:uncharacterized membrane protein YfcA
LLGGFAGVVAGLLGVGGGLIIVPFLLLIWHAGGFVTDSPMQQAVGTSLAIIILTSLSSVYAHHRYGAVDWRIVKRLLPGIVTGGLFGAVLAVNLPSGILRQAFGIFELLVALQMGFGWRPDPQRELPRPMAMGIIGAFIGSVSSFLGVAGGTLVVPFLTWCNVVMQRAVGTAAACGIPIAVAGSTGFIWLGWGEGSLASGSAGYVYVPALLSVAAASVLFAPVGAWLAHRASPQVLKKGFALFLAILGVWMLGT